MNIYAICELQNLHSIREGVIKEFKSLRDAKMYATKNQVFQGTVMAIYDKRDGLEELITYKQNGRWLTIN